MQVYSNSKRLSKKTFFFLLAFVFIAFLPISSFLFFLKNDAFTGYFPPKLFMSEALHEGILPLWNPFINFGIPQYGDMSSGYWSPITWLIAATVGYTAYSFTIEILAYLFIAGLGMYMLGKSLGWINSVCLIAALAYTSSGYMVGHMQHFNWISGASFLPLCLWRYKIFLQSASGKNLLASTLTLYLLFSSAHPGISIGAGYFFIGYIIFHMWTSEKLRGKILKEFVLPNLILLAALLLISCGMIMAYLDVLPHLTRNAKPAIESITNPTSFSSYISFLLPLSTVKNNAAFATDISMRNVYFSLLLFIFGMLALLTAKHKEQKFWLITALVFLLLASGGWVSNLLYRFIPLIGYVRLPGEYSIFAIFALIIASGSALNQFMQDAKPPHTLLKRIIKITGALLIAFLAFSIVKIITTHDSILWKSGIYENTNITEQLKFVIDHLSFYDCIFIQSIIQLIIIAALSNFLHRKNPMAVVWVVTIDLALATLLNLPFTAAGKSSLKHVHEVLQNSPKGFPIPPLQPILLNDTGSVENNMLVGSWSFYNKMPGNSKLVPYPIELNHTRMIFETINSEQFSQPFVFIKNNSNHPIHITTFRPHEMHIKIPNNLEGDTLVMQQAWYPHWKGFVNGKEVSVTQFKSVYLQLPLAAGSNVVRFVFKPRHIIVSMTLSAVFFLIALFVWIYLAVIKKQKRT